MEHRERAWCAYRVAHELLHRGFDMLEHLIHLEEREALQLARLAREPAVGLREEELPQGVHAQQRNELITLEQRVERLLQDVLRLGALDIRTQEREAAQPVHIQWHAAVESEVLSAAHRPLEAEAHLRCVLLAQVRLELASSALGILTTVVEVRECAADDAHALRLDPLKGRELVK